MDHQAPAPDSTGAAIGQAWHVGPWPERLVPPQAQRVDPANQVTLDERARIATLVVLERLTSAERTAFVLHDVFQLSFALRNGLIKHIHAIANRSKLAHVTSLLQPA